MEIEFLDRFSKNTQTSYFMKTRPVDGKLFHTDRRTDRHDRASSLFSQFCEQA